MADLYPDFSVSKVGLSNFTNSDTGQISSKQQVII